jgi:[ribosomal protein S5]-alanine N-acetyltransferase
MSEVLGAVFIRAPKLSDRAEFVSLMRASRSFHRPWATAPVDDERFNAYVADARRPDFEALLACRREDNAILGFFNLSQITRGRLQSAYLGYAAGKPYAGQGFMRQAIELVLRHAFVVLRLHRVEANIQPGNQASIRLARGAGFRREGFSPRYLKIGGRWRDHERWAILSEEWRLGTAAGDQDALGDQHADDHEAPVGAGGDGAVTARRGQIPPLDSGALPT